MVIWTFQALCVIHTHDSFLVSVRVCYVEPGHHRKTSPQKLILTCSSTFSRTDLLLLLVWILDGMRGLLIGFHSADTFVVKLLSISRSL